MKVLKWLVIFIVAFLFAWILIFTFIQPQFKVLASAKILTYTTPQIPIYFYVAGAFAIGLILGLFTAFYYYIVLQKKVHQATRELHAVEEKLANAQRTLEQSEMAHSFDGFSSIPEETIEPEPIEDMVAEEDDIEPDKDTPDEEPI